LPACPDRGLVLRAGDWVNGRPQADRASDATGAVDAVTRERRIGRRGGQAGRWAYLQGWSGWRSGPFWWSGVQAGAARLT